MGTQEREGMGVSKCLDKTDQLKDTLLIAIRQTLSWYTNPTSGISVTAAESKGLALGTAHVPISEIHTYQNFSRSSSLVSRFGNQERVEKLKALKMKWDPTGLFSGQFLEEL